MNELILQGIAKGWQRLAVYCKVIAKDFAMMIKATKKKKISLSVTLQICYCRKEKRRITECKGVNKERLQRALAKTGSVLQRGLPKILQ